MYRYKVRVHTLIPAGFITHAEHYEDYNLQSPEPLEGFATELAAKGFADPANKRWVMPGAIVWVESMD
jgi:hypothetical protein